MCICRNLPISSTIARSPDRRIRYGGGWLADAESLARGLLADHDVAVPQGEGAAALLDDADCPVQPADLAAEAEKVVSDCLESDPTIQLLLARVSLGRCKDFEGRCCSNRSVGGEITDAEWPKRQRGRRDHPPRAWTRCRPRQRPLY